MDQLNMNKRQSHKTVKHTQTICWQKPTICLSVFDHFVKLELKGIMSSIMKKYTYTNKKEHYTKIWPTIFFYEKAICVAVKKSFRIVSDINTVYFSIREKVFEMKTETIMSIIFGEWSL